MRMHLTWPERLHAHPRAHARESFENGPLHQSWALNKGLFALSSVVIAWALFAVLTLQGLSGLSHLPQVAGWGPSPGIPSAATRPLLKVPG